MIENCYIDSCYSLLDRVGEFDELVVKNEPMLFNCDLPHAEQLGGPITREVLAHLPSEWRDVPLVVDSRVHMLMTDWYPCIPGWHHDDVPRTRTNGQPNYGPGQCRSSHIVCLVNGDICPTAFATGVAAFVVPKDDEVVYGKWHDVVEGMVHSGVLNLSHIPSNQLLLMNDRTWHTGTRAVRNGWRFFIRASRYFDPDGQPIPRGNVRTNEVRRQVQVYLNNSNAGW